MYGKLHGLQIHRGIDHTAYHVYNDDSIVHTSKSVYDDRTVYENVDDSSRDSRELTYYNDESKIEVRKNDDDSENYITYIRE